LGKTRICSPLDNRANIQALAGILYTGEILAKPLLSLIPKGSRHTMAIVNFVVHYILPVFNYLFIAGLIGAVPVIIITAVKTAQSMLEED
jgi:hypothetical protein